MDVTRISTLPVEFTIIKQYESKDCRFLDVTIDVLHTGKNCNGSIFQKDVVDKCIPSIQNTPILGRIKIDKDGNTDDFEAHEYRIIENDSGVRMLYDGSAYGVIPESCNPRWVQRISSDGVMRDYLQVDAILWTKFERPIEIFERDGRKGQSMELAKNFKGYEDEEGYFVFTDFKFDGCCILSTTDPQIQPAMIDSNIAANFSAQSVAEQIKQQLEKYSKVKGYPNSEMELPIDNPIKEGGNNQLNTQAELLVKYNLSVGDLDFNIDEIPEDELEGKLADFSKVLSRNSTEEPVNEKTAPANFALAEQFLDSLLEVIGEEKLSDPDYPEWEYSRYWYVDYDSECSEVYVLDGADYHLYGFPYSMNGDKVVVDFACKKRKKYAIVDFNEGDPETNFVKDYADFTCKNAVKKLEADFQAKEETYKSDYSAKETELDNLKIAYEKVSKNYNQKIADEVFEKFELELSGDPTYEALKTNSDSMTADEIENQCFCILGRKKLIFNKSTVRSPVKIPMKSVEDSDEKLPYGGLFQKFKKD